MPLTITSPASGIFPTTVSAADTFSMGFRLVLDGIMTRTSIGAGDRLFFNVSFTEGSGAPSYPANYEVGWVGTIPAAGTVSFGLLGNDVSARAFAPTSLRITRSGAGEVTFQMLWFPHQDMLTLDNSSDTFLSNQLTKPSRLSSSPFDFSPACVYNGERTMVIHVGYADSAAPNTIIEEVQFFKTLRVAHWNRDLNAVEGGDLSDVTWKLDVAGVPVPQLVAGSSTRVRATFKCAGFTPHSDPACGLFLDTGSGNIVSAQKLSGIYYPNLNITHTIPQTGLIAISQIESLGGDYYRATFIVSAAWIEPGQQYRLFVAVLDAAQTRSRSILSPPIAASQFFPPSTGVISYSGMSYDRHSKIWDTDCLQGVAPLERLRLCWSMDKADYNASVISNGAAGNFDVNFVGGRLLGPTLNYPATVPDISASGTAISAPSFLHNNGNCIYCTDMRVPPAFAGSTFYMTLVWIFRVVPPDSDPYFDYVVAPFEIRANAFEPDDDLGLVVFEGFTDLDDNPLTSVQCRGAGRIKACFSFTGADPETYSFFPLAYFAGAALNDIREHNNYLNDNLPPMGTALIPYTDRSFNDLASEFGPPTLGTACLTIDTDLIPLDTLFCLAGVAKAYDDAEPPDPAEPVSCATYDITVTVTTSNATLNTVEVDIEVVVDNFIPGSFSVQDIIVQASTPEIAPTFRGMFSGDPATANFTGVVDGGGENRKVLLVLNIDVFTSDGSNNCKSHTDIAVEAAIEVGSALDEVAEITSVNPMVMFAGYLPPVNGNNIRIFRPMSACAEAGSYTRAACELYVRDCDATPELLLADTPWNCQLCQTDHPFFLPFYEGIRFMIQARFVDILSADPEAPDTEWKVGYDAWLYDGDGNLVTDDIDLFCSRYLAAWDGRGSYQVLEVDTSMPIFNFLQCFSIRVIAYDAGKNIISEFWSHHFGKVKPDCVETTWIEGLYESWDCFGQYYGDAVAVAGATPPFRYSNGLLVPLEVLASGDAIEKTVFARKAVRTVLTRLWRAVMQEPIPPFLKNYIVGVVLSAAEVYMDGVLYDVPEFNVQNRLRNTRMFLFDIELGRRCELDFRCQELGLPTPKPFPEPLSGNCINCVDEPCIEDVTE